MTILIADGVCDRQSVLAEKLRVAAGVSNCWDVTESHLNGISGSLDLSDSGVDSFWLKARDFAMLTDVSALDLSGNALRSLPAGVLGEMTSLATLDLSDNSLSGLPSGVFDSTSALVTLDLSGNSLSSVPLGVFDATDALTTLNLSGNSLSNVPEGTLGGAASLTTLDLSDNQFTTLNDGIFGRVRNLTSLDMSGNPGTITEVGDGGESVSYVGVNASTTQRASVQQVWLEVPSGAPFAMQANLSATPSTAKLWLNGIETNTLTIRAGANRSTPIYFTDAAGTQVSVSIDSLEILDPSNDQITWSNRMSGLKTARGGVILVDVEGTPTALYSAFALSGVEGESIPFGVWLMYPVATVEGYLDIPLNVSYGTASSQDVTFRGGAEGLNVRIYDGSTQGNGTIEVVNDQDLEGTEDFKVKLGQPGEDDPWLLGTNSWFDYEIMDDGICDRTQDIRYGIVRTLHRIGTLDHSKGCGDVTDSHLGSILKLSLFLLNIGDLQVGDFAGLTAMEVLDMFGSKVTGAPVGVFDGLTSLEFISLDYNPLSSVDSGLFDGLETLRGLGLYHNELSELPDDIFDDLTRLKYLNLGNNSLKTLSPTHLDQLTELETLDISYNQLSGLDAGLVRSSAGLKMLNFEGNGMERDDFYGDNIPDGFFEGMTKLQIVMAHQFPDERETRTFEYDVYMTWSEPRLDSEGVCEADLSIPIGNPLHGELMLYVQFFDGSIVMKNVELLGGATSKTIRFGGYGKVVEWVIASQSLTPRHEADDGARMLGLDGIVYEQFGYSLHCPHPENFNASEEEPEIDDSPVRIGTLVDVMPLFQKIRADYGLSQISASALATLEGSTDGASEDNTDGQGGDSSTQ